MVSPSLRLLLFVLLRLSRPLLLLPRLSLLLLLLLMVVVGVVVVVVVVIEREKSLKAVSIYCLGLLESYNLREDNKRGMYQ